MALEAADAAVGGRPFGPTWSGGTAGRRSGLGLWIRGRDAVLHFGFGDTFDVG